MIAAVRFEDRLRARRLMSNQVGEDRYSTLRMTVAERDALADAVEALRAIAEKHIPETRNDYQAIARRALARLDGDA